MAGFIKIYRDVLDTVLFSKPVLLQMWLLLSKQARYVKTVQEGIEIQPGQVLISAGELAQRCNLTERRVRYILDCLEEMELISRENIRNRYTLITLTNPDELRCVKQTDLHNPTVRATQNAEPQPEKVQKSAYGVCGNVYLSTEEKEMLKQRSPAADSYIDRLSAYKRRTNKTYNDDFAVLCEWISKDEINEAAKPAPAVSKPVKENRPNPSLSRYQDMNTDFFTAPASYDLERAERLARERVPTLKKRPKP
ncbi:MAG: hypothetical protein IKJ63_08440 [Clostridia bacterium]|nr:hypothetical protein [Clostridia bacterium]